MTPDPQVEKAGQEVQEGSARGEVVTLWRCPTHGLIDAEHYFGKDDDLAQYGCPMAIGSDPEGDACQAEIEVEHFTPLPPLAEVRKALDLAVTVSERVVIGNSTTTDHYRKSIREARDLLADLLEGSE